MVESEEFTDVQDWFTDAFKLQSEKFGLLNIAGQRVEVRKISMKGSIGTFFNAYAKLKDSSKLSEEFLGYPTFQEGDVVGVDSAHAFNTGQDEAQKLLSVLAQIECCIDAWKSAIKGGD